MSEIKEPDKVWKAFREMQKRHGDKRTDEEVLKATEKAFYYTEEEAEEEIKALMAGPLDYVVERNATELVVKTREEMIADVRRLTRKRVIQEEAQGILISEKVFTEKSDKVMPMNMNRKEINKNK